MKIGEAATRLKASYDAAPAGYKVVYIHLFAIRHAREIADMPLKDLLQRAGLKTSYATELQKGIRLAEFVEPKQAKQ